VATRAPNNSGFGACKRSVSRRESISANTARLSAISAPQSAQSGAPGFRMHQYSASSMGLMATAYETTLVDALSIILKKVMSPDKESNSGWFGHSTRTLRPGGCM